MTQQASPAPRDEHGRYLPGASGNPGGRPKGSVSLVTAIRHELERRQDSGQPGIEAVAARLVDLALDGDIRAVREIGDRLDGKATQSVDVSSSEPLVLAPIAFERRI
jgi:hypothetical protein